MATYVYTMIAGVTGLLVGMFTYANYRRYQGGSIIGGLTWTTKSYWAFTMIVLLEWGGRVSWQTFTVYLVFFMIASAYLVIEVRMAIWPRT